MVEKSISLIITFIVPWTISFGQFLLLGEPTTGRFSRLGRLRRYLIKAVTTRKDTTLNMRGDLMAKALKSLSAAADVIV
jgi:hypothetical protein